MILRCLRPPVVLLLFACAAVCGQAVPPPQRAIPAIIAAFDRHPVVAIGESHWLKQAGEFYVELVRSPEFCAKVNDIVVEFSTPRYQAVLDRYVNGEKIPEANLREVWRNTTKTFAWESPIYPRLLAAIREVNRNLPPERRLRVLGGDAPIDWKNVHTHEEWAKFQPNDAAFAETITGQVLAKKRKALVILGSNHLTKGGDRNGGPDTTTRVEESYPGSMYIVLLASRGFGASDFMQNWHAPVIAHITPGWAASIPFGQRHLADSGDAVLYLGPPDSLTKAEPIWDNFDSAYLKELDRRSRIEWGCGFDIERWKKAAQPCP